MMPEVIKISMVGIGGAGCNSVRRFNDVAKGRMLHINTIAIDCDKNGLSQCEANTSILIGEKLTQGRGAGGDPETGKRAAEESGSFIREAIKDSDIVFLVAGFGGGPVPAQAALWRGLPKNWSP
jgi:cell division protein FtsZ